MAASELEAAAENHQIALDAIEFRNARKMRPRLESEASKQREARRIVSEDEAEQRLEPELRRAANRFGNQLARIASALRIRRDVDAQLSRRMIGRTAVKGLEADPSFDDTVVLNHPQRPRLR